MLLYLCKIKNKMLLFLIVLLFFWNLDEYFCQNVIISSYRPVWFSSFDTKCIFYIGYLVNSDGIMPWDICPCTKNEAKPYVIIELAKVYEIDYIEIILAHPNDINNIFGIKPELLSDNNEIISYCEPIPKFYMGYNTKTKCNNLKAKKIRIWKKGPGVLQICKIMVTGVVTGTSLLSRNKNTKTSYGDWTSQSKFNDGNYRQDNMYFCFQSSNSSEFWMVDLNGIFLIDFIHLYSSLDRKENMIGLRIELLSKNYSIWSICTTIFEEMEVYYIPCNLQKAEIVLIRQIRPTIVIGCEIDIFGVEFYSLLSRGKPTSQSSNYEINGPAYLNSSYAVDGDYNQYMNYAKCATTHYEMAYWMVDLESTYKISVVSIYNRADCCSGRILGAVVELLNSTNKLVHTCGSISTVETHYKIICASKLANKIRIRHTREDILTLCEVDVQGTLP